MATGKNELAPNADGSGEHGNDGATGDDGSVVTGIDNSPTSIGGIPVVKPSGTNPTSDAPRKRGRPAGSTGKSGPREKAPATTLKGIEKILFSLHAGVAGLTGVSELEISKEESATMTEAIAEVASHYNATVDPKVLAWIGFAGAMGTIYGPRVAAWKIRRSVEKKGDKAKSNVVALATPGPLINGFPLPGQTG